MLLPPWPPPAPPPPPATLCSSLARSISAALRFIRSLVSATLLSMTILCSRSSCDSISQAARTCAGVTASRCPSVTASSKANKRSKAAAATPSSSIGWT